MSDDEQERMAGTWHTPIPCPECGRFMSTGYDGLGFPAASCRSGGCDVEHRGIDWLLAGDYWTEGSA